MGKQKNSPDLTISDLSRFLLVLLSRFLLLPVPLPAAGCLMGPASGSATAVVREEFVRNVDPGFLAIHPRDALGAPQDSPDTSVTGGSGGPAVMQDPFAAASATTVVLEKGTAST